MPGQHRPKQAVNARLDRNGASWLDLAMKFVKIADLKNRLSEHLRAVEKGAEVTVTDRNRPIARIVPEPPERSGLTYIPAKRSLASIHSRKYRPARWAVPSSALLADERGER